MTEKNNEQHDIDEFFKDQFGDFEVPKLRPSEPIEEEDAIDQLFQNRFEELEQTPDERIWENVKKELPLHLIWKKRLNHLSRIAAILLIGLFLSVFISKESSAILSLVGNDAPAPVEETSPEAVVKPSDFVFDAQTKDQLESSKALFQDDAEANMAANEAEEALNKALLNPLSPLPSLPLQEVSIAEGESMAQSKDELQNAIVSPMINADDAEMDQYDADIIARGNQVNPAQ